MWGKEHNAAAIALWAGASANHAYAPGTKTTQVPHKQQYTFAGGAVGPSIRDRCENELTLIGTQPIDPVCRQTYYREVTRERYSFLFAHGAGCTALATPSLDSSLGRHPEWEASRI